MQPYLTFVIIVAIIMPIVLQWVRESPIDKQKPVYLERPRPVDCWRSNILTSLLHISANLATGSGHLHAYPIIYPLSPREGCPQAVT